MLHGSKENSMLVKCLAACSHLSSTFLRYIELLVENCDIFRPHLCLAALQGVTPSEFREDLSIQKKTRMNGLSCCEKNHDKTFSRFDRVPACDGRTDRRTSRLYFTCFSVADARKNGFYVQHRAIDNMALVQHSRR